MIPVECFDPDDAGAYTDAVTIMHDARETPYLGRAGVEADAKLVHSRFVLRNQGHVAIYRSKISSSPSKQSCRLLLSLKSLSGASSFELYVQGTERIESTMRNLLRNFCKGTFRTPKRDYKSTVNGRL